MAFVNAIAIRPTAQRTVLCKGFFGARTAVPAPATMSKSTVRMLENIQPAFVKAMEDYKTQYAPFANKGWGATVKAERWNGRHVMFGWLMLVGTAYAKSHGLLPEGNLDLTQWGVLGALGDQQPISMERAAVLVAHIHFLFVSLAAAIAPFSFQDKLLLDDGEADAAPAGLFPPFKVGLTPDAEIWNGRVAMVGLITLVAVSVASHQSILARTISETLEFMNAHNIEAPVPIYNCAFAGLMRDGRADTIERTIEKMWAMQGFSHPNAASYNYLISASFCGGNVDKAFGVLQDMKKRMIYPSFGTYHTLIAGCVRVGDPHRGFETLLAVEQQRFEMSALTIGQVMVACADADDISAVSQLITRFEDALGRYVHELDNLIDRRARRETSDSVHRPSQVERGEPKLEISGLMALLHSAYRGAQPNIAERAMSWFKEWYPEYRVPASAWYCLIGSYALAGDCPSAFDAIARMRTAGYTPMTKELHESLIKPLSTHLEKVDEQFYRLADRLASAKPPAVSQTPSALNNSSSGQADVPDDAVAISEDAGQHRQEMNEGSTGGSPVPSSEDRASSDTAAKDVNASLSESVISNKPDGGSKIIPDAISGDNAEILDVGIDEMNCIIAACSLAGDLERAFQTYDEAQRYGLNRNVDTFNSLLMGCVVTRHAKGALRIADEMKECNVPFNDETVFLLTRLFMRLGAFDDALRTMEEATNNGVELSTGTFQIIARKCFRIGRRDDVKKIVALAEQNGITSEAVFGRVESHFLRGSDEEEGGDDSDALEVSSRSSLVGYDGNGADGPDAETMPEGRTAGPTSWNEDKQVGTAGGKVLV